MPTITFLYGKKEVNIQCDKNENMEIVTEKFCQELNILKRNIKFLYNGTALNMDCTEDDIILNKENKKFIIV